MTRTLLHDETLASAGSFDVSSISQDYDDLLIILAVRGDVSATDDLAYLFFNNDTTVTNYHSQSHYSLNNTGHATGEVAAPYIPVPGDTAPTDSFSSIEIYIIDYTSTNYLKTALIKGGTIYNTLAERETTVGFFWEDGGTTAISRVTIVTDNDPTDEFVAGSRLIIWGIS